MIGLDEEDDYDKPRNNPGGRIAEDDLSVGDFVCVYNLKKTEDGAPIMGQSLHIKAICLPYFVGQLLSDPSEPVLTLDCRYLNLMRVTPEFVEAQKAGAKQQGNPNMMAPPRKRKQQEPP
jgi:hypothetical protein